MRKMRNFVVVCVIFSAICIFKASGLDCFHCGRVIGNRCEFMINLPVRTCKDWSPEDREDLGVRPACVTSTRIIKNVTYWDRMCGQIGGDNDTCEIEEDKYPGIPVTCVSCEVDWCNGTDDMDSNSIFLLLSMIFVISMRML